MSENKENLENQEIEENEENKVNETTELKSIEETHNVMPSEPKVNSAKAAVVENSNNNGLAWVLGGLLLIAAVAIVWMLVSDGKAGTPDSAVVATINGEEITKDELYDIATPDIAGQMLDQAILVELVNQEADKENIEITDAEINEAADKYMTDIISGFPTEEAFNQQLIASGMTKESLTVDIKEGIPFELKMKKLLEPQVDVSDEKIASFFEENKESIMQSLKVTASHILVEDEQLANSLLQQIKDGADFATLASENSTDTVSKAKGGDLGSFGRGEMVPEFENAAYSLEVGEVSEVVASQHGFHIIKLTDKETLTLEEDKEEIKDMLLNSEISRLAQEWIPTLRESADIKMM